ncbi:MAG: hypothetical protein ACJ8FY_06340 [Gemmataceae bacterium]
MRPEKLEELLRRRPFVPVRVYLSDGTTYDIRHPEMALLTRSTIDIGLTAQQGSTIADKVVYCSLIHIEKADQVQEEKDRHSGIG